MQPVESPLCRTCSGHRRGVPASWFWCRARSSPHSAANSRASPIHRINSSASTPFPNASNPACPTTAFPPSLRIARILSTLYFSQVSCNQIIALSVVSMHEADLTTSLNAGAASLSCACILLTLIVWQEGRLDSLKIPKDPNCSPEKRGSCGFLTIVSG